jgi:hypothetical protein
MKNVVGQNRTAGQPLKYGQDLFVHADERNGTLTAFSEALPSRIAHVFERPMCHRGPTRSE